MKRTIIASLTIFLIAFLFHSCTKLDSTDLGDDLIPAVDNINTFETVLDVVSDNRFFNDTTEMLYDELHGLGAIDNDPEFGKTTASIYSSFTPTIYRSYPFTLKDTVVIDSVILSLAYNSLYGDSNSIQRFEVREIDPESTFTDSLYRLGSPDLPTLPTLIGAATINFLTLNDSIKYINSTDTVSSGGEMRIPLDTAWARHFVNYDTTNAYNSDSAFKKVFKGVEIKVNEGASPVKSALAYFDLGDATRTRITFYCRIQKSGKTDTISPFFTYTQDPHANMVRRTPANGYFTTVTNAVANDEKLYIQSTPGSYALIKIPGIDTLMTTNRVIHRAELIVEKYPSLLENIYTPPPVMFIDQLNMAGDSAFTIRNDYIPVNSATVVYDLNRLGGGYKADKYIFNLSRYIQSIVTNKFPNYPLRVYAPFTTTPYYKLPNSDQATSRQGIILNTPVGTGRVVVYGGGSADPRRMRMRIIYSKI